MGYIEGEDRNQIILFPESIDEYIGDNNSIRMEKNRGSNLYS